MSYYRNRYFLLGILLLLIGAQFRMIDSFVLNEPTTKLLAKVTKSKVSEDTTTGSIFWNVAPAEMTRKRIYPPRWLGLAMMAVGAVFSFHAIAIPRHRD